MQNSARYVSGCYLFSGEEGTKSCGSGLPLPRHLRTVSLQFNFLQRGNVFTVLPHGFLFYILNIWAFFSLFLSPSLAPLFSVLLFFPLLQSALGCTCYGRDSSTANKSTTFLHCHSALLGLDTGKPNSKKTWEVSLWKEWGTGVWECEFMFFPAPFNNNDCKWLFSYSSHSSEVWEEKKEMFGLFKVANFVLGRRGILIWKYQIPVSLASPATPLHPHMPNLKVYSTFHCIARIAASSVAGWALGWCSMADTSQVLFYVKKHESALWVHIRSGWERLPLISPHVPYFPHLLKKKAVLDSLYFLLALRTLV